MLIALLLFCFGLFFGSFVNALVWRLHEQGKGRGSRGKGQKKDLSILSGRSVCPNCRHVLAWYDLIPVISWLMLRGRCRYCGRPISVQYPLVEMTAAVIFAGSYVFWPYSVHENGQWLLLATWLTCSVGLLALAVYDLRWMLLPNKIIYPTLVAAVAGRVAYIAFFEDRPLYAIGLWAISILITSGLFFVIYIFSKGKWIGFGDVRLGLITGTLLAKPSLCLAMLFFASLLGCVAVLPSLIRGQKNMSSRLPYGPFLITATAFMVVFGPPLVDWYRDLIL